MKTGISVDWKSPTVEKPESMLEVLVVFWVAGFSWEGHPFRYVFRVAYWDASVAWWFFPKTDWEKGFGPILDPETGEPMKFVNPCYWRYIERPPSFYDNSPSDIEEKT